MAEKKEKTFTINESAECEFPAWSSTFCNLTPRHRTVGQAEVCYKVALYNGKLDEYNLPTDKDWEKHVGGVLVESKVGEKKGQNLESTLPNMQLARSLLLGATSMLGLDSTRSRVSAAIVQHNMSGLKILFEGLAADGKPTREKAVVAYYDKVQGMPKPFQLFFTIGEIETRVNELMALVNWLDANLGGAVTNEEKQANKAELKEVKALF
jgi:hypothetical protein